ncbi:MAG: redoxin domain-containing protein [Cytophagales bacterium]|nr:redoxin domain-containing protein [Cytophaga sp.]
MKKLLIPFFFLISIQLCLAQNTPYINFAQLEKIIYQQDDTLRIVNFWATWCKPCIEELPDFEKVSADYATKKVKVILVSMDFKSKIDVQLKPYITKNNIHSQVVVLDQTDSNIWINKLSKEWSGSIPATVFTLQSKQLLFHEGKYSHEELVKYIQQYIQP